jgi:hypothetical protein
MALSGEKSSRAVHPDYRGAIAPFGSERLRVL